MKIGQKIKNYRTQLDWTQETLAQKIKVSRQTISNWENDKSYPDIYNIKLLAEAFNLDPAELFKEDLDIMTETINYLDIKQHRAFAIEMVVAMVISGGLFLISMLTTGSVSDICLGAAGMAWLMVIFFTVQIQEINRKYQLKTFKDIKAFSEGKIAEPQKYQPHRLLMGLQFLLILSGPFIGLLLAYLFIG